MATESAKASCRLLPDAVLTDAALHHHSPPHTLAQASLPPAVRHVNAGCRLARTPFVMNEDDEEALDVSSLSEPFLAFHKLDPEELKDWAPQIREEAEAQTAAFTT